MSDTELFQRFSHVRLVNPATAEMSDTELSPRFSHVRLVNPATAEISDTELFPRFSVLRLVNPATAEISEMLLFQRYNLVRWVKPAIADISEILLSPRFSVLSFVKPVKGEKSDIELLLIERFSASTYSAPRSSVLRLVAPSSPVKSLMLAFLASRLVRFPRCPRKMGVLGGSPIRFRNRSAKVGVGDVDLSHRLKTNPHQPRRIPQFDRANIRPGSNGCPVGRKRYRIDPTCMPESGEIYSRRHVPQLDRAIPPPGGEGTSIRRKRYGRDRAPCIRVAKFVSVATSHNSIPPHPPEARIASIGRKRHRIDPTHMLWKGGEICSCRYVPQLDHAIP